MTYCPRTKQFVVNTGGIVFIVKILSLKHSVPCNISVVFETYTENPRYSSANDPKSVKKKMGYFQFESIKNIT